MLFAFESIRRRRASARVFWGLTVVVALIVSTRFVGAGENGESDVVELFGDVNFERGFSVYDNSRKPIYRGDLKLSLDEDSKDEAAPVWGLAQHNSKYELVGAPIIREGRRVRASTPGQTVALEKNDRGEVVLTLEVSTDKDYEAPRKANEPWIHLLLTRDFSEKEQIPFRDVESLTFSCDARVRDFERKRLDEDYDPTIHATQASVYFTFQNGNPESEDYRDYVWFGISFFDDRYEVQANYFEIDGDPKTIGTGKLIYRVGGRETIDDVMGGTNPYAKERVHIEADLKRYLSDALKCAQSRGLLLKTRIDDFTTGHFNFGWETPGIFHSTLEIENLRLLARLKSKPSDSDE